MAYNYNPTFQQYGNYGFQANQQIPQRYSITRVNGVAQPETLTRFTAVVGSYQNLSFEDLITVPRGNSNCCYSSPTTVQVGVYSLGDVTGDLTFANISQLVTRMC